ncbi:Chromosome partition protein Smc [Candidatus Methanoperedenaceae archaeon GB50]|nr:Chromosome partition protein Smc [Candidatus Methanoperedenaceae archaeon GB50]CAD7774313.1 MAG: Chromosome partition protein Smc [Candidatus Methanoperedenaceae archaeon GB50]
MGLSVQIREIVFENFKSFGKKTKLSFFDGFTAISGPNGSGKSNIIDGIIFCMGLSGSRTMRAEKLTDLIYNDGAKSSDSAEVSITIDNSTGELPRRADLVTITRRVKKTSTGYYSYYYIDGRAATLSEIHEELRKANITPEGYNVIMQGDVTRIIEMTPFERRKIIDEIAGVSEFDEKKNRALGELEIVRERIERVEIILEEVQAQLQRLKEERDHALKYRSLRDERRRYEGFIILARLNDSKRELGSIERELNERSKRRESACRDYEQMRGALESLEGELSGLNEEILKKGGSEQIRVKKEIEEIRREKEVSKKTIDLLLDEISDVDTAKRKALLEIETLREKIRGFEGRLKEEELRRDTLRSEIDERNREMEAVKKRIAEVDSEYSGVQEVLSELKKRVERIKSEKNELIREEDRLLDAIRRKTRDATEIEEEIRESREKISSEENDRERLVREMQEITRGLEDLSSDLEDLESKRARLRREISELDEELGREQQMYMRIEAEVKAARDAGGYSRAVESIIEAKRNRELEGIYGTIADLGRTDKRYATSLEIAAGAGLQFIVVATDEDAAYAIAHLKERGSGRATFLPLNRLAPKRDLEKPDQKGVIDYAVNLVEYDTRFDRAFWYVFRDTLIVETLSDARRLMGKYRMVTLEGDLVERGGAMTGGTIRSRLGFARREDEKLSRLREKITELESRRKTTVKRLEETESHIYTLHKEIAQSEKTLSKKQLELEDLKGRGDRLAELIKKREEELELIKNDRIAIKREMEELEEEKTLKNNKIRELEGEIHKLEEKMEGSPIPGLTEEISRLQEKIDHFNRRIVDVEGTINSINLEKRYAEERIGEIREKTHELDTRREERLKRIEELREKIKEFDERLRERKKREEELSIELAELQKEREKVEKTYDDTKERVMQIKITIKELDSEILGLNRTMEAINEQIIEMQREVEERGLDEGMNVPTSHEIHNRIKKIEREMERLEPVNMRAIDEYDEVREREEDLQSRRETLSHERRELLKRIKQYEEMKHDAFMESYNCINRHFKEIFRELSGGTGEIVLENPEDPFAGGLTIRARPAGKTEQRLEAMSGGEKSLTALALIFAIQEYRPAPFYAFDEIDMFLDSSNVQRVAERIKKSSKKAQFIVVTLRKPMIEVSNRIIGVTMQENNITTITGVKTR